MTGNRIAAGAVQKLMRNARRLSRQIDRLLEPLPSGWSVAPYDPNVLFDAFPLLQLRDGFQLAAYQFHERDESNGLVLVIPVRRWLPEPSEYGLQFEYSSYGASGFYSTQPLPEWVHADIENFLEGDGSPVSYFQASIFLREVREMGAGMRSCSWCAHEVVSSAAQLARQKWTWQEKRPRDWRPAAGQDAAGKWRVSFYTHTGLGRERVVAHHDVFMTGYGFDAEENVIAFGEGGYVL